MEYLLHMVAPLKWFNCGFVSLAEKFLTVCGLVSKLCYDFDICFSTEIYNRLYNNV